jgi:predicted phage baseplate assembly protein
MMFLPLPTLDDRRWSDLVEEARALIPLYGPEWTDHNVSDPGVTYAELLAWITEMDLFQLDQVPVRHRLKFLALLGITPRPPVPASTVLRFEIPPLTPPVLIPPTMEYEGRDPYNNPVGVRTLYAVQVVGTELRRIQVHHAGVTTDLTDRWRRSEPFLPLGPDPRPGAALLLELSAALPAGVPITIMLTPAAAHARLERKHHSARTVWELQLGGDQWLPLPAQDQTRSLTQSGRVEFTVPDGTKIQPGTQTQMRCRMIAGAYDAPPLLSDIAINGVPAVQSVTAGKLTWPVTADAAVSGYPTPGGRSHVGLRLDDKGRVVRVDFDDANAPSLLVLEFQPAAGNALGTLTIEARSLGVGTGAPGQVFICQPAPQDRRFPVDGPWPVDAASLDLYTLESTGWQHWIVRPDLDASSPEDRHAVLDPTTGAVTFGDGRYGQAVPDGATVIAVYRHTAAAAGNLRAGKIAVLSTSPHNEALLTAAGSSADQIRQVKVTNPVPLAGGAAAETLDDAERRAAELGLHPTRAVTIADYEELARQTPGVQLARVSARANAHPGFPCVEAIGVVTVIVLPHLPVGRPMPSSRLLRAVSNHLCRLRLVGTRVEVIGPTYTEIAVRAKVQAARVVSGTDLSRRIALALNDFFDPLHGGPDGQGWPFGRDVYRLEVMQVLDEVPGVEHVVELDLRTADGAQCGTVCLGPNGLIAAGRHEIEVVA